MYNTATLLENQTFFVWRKNCSGETPGVQSDLRIDGRSRHRLPLTHRLGFFHPNRLLLTDFRRQRQSGAPH